MPYYTCPYCWKKGNQRTKHIDHIIPTVRGGCNCVENKVSSCGYCNRQKKDKTALEYFGWLIGIDHFKHWDYTKRDMDKLLVNLGTLEINAVKHMKDHHRVKPSYRK